MFVITVSLLFTADTLDDSLTAVTYSDYLMHACLPSGLQRLHSRCYSGLDTSIFILAVVIVPLILLNMLIAILGDTYDPSEIRAGTTGLPGNARADLPQRSNCKDYVLKEEKEKRHAQGGEVRIRVSGCEVPGR